MTTRNAFIFALVITAPWANAFAVDFFVSPDGNDAWDGMRATQGDGQAGPVATLEGVRDAIRKRKPRSDENIVVHLAPGTYVLQRPFVLSAKDAGTDTGRIVYDAGTPGSVRLMGGRVIEGFAPVTDSATLSRLDESARANVVSANLRAQGVTDYGNASGGGLELFYDGEPMQIARWPNDGFVKIAEEAGGEPFDVRGTKGDRIGRWVYDGDRPSRWLDEPDGWLYGYWFWDWSAQHQKIKSIDPENRIIEAEKPYHGYGYRKGQWYYALNLLSELDEPGEWFLDRESGELFFWPPGSIDDTEIFVSSLDHAVVFDSVSHTTLRGVVIEGVRDTAIRMTGGAGNRVVACTIRNSGGSAISVSGGRDHGVVGCDIYNVGAAGISLDGGDRETLTPGGHFAVNNHIHDYARWYRMYQAGVSLRGVGHRVAHNLIHNAPHMAMSFGGNDHVIEFNEIHSVCYESNDAGAIYAGRDWTERGTVIRHNFMHHVTGFEDRGCVGVYLDDMFCGTAITGNVFYKVYRAAFIGGGRDNVYENNLFIECPKALHIDNRAQNWAGYHVETTMTDRLNAMPYRSPRWKERYPRLVDILEDEPAAPKGNRIARNIFYRSDWDDVYEGARPYIEFEQNFVDVDPHLAGPEVLDDTGTPRATDFRFDHSTPVFESGFEMLLLDKMGLYEDPDRATWPVEHAVRR